MLWHVLLETETVSAVSTYGEAIKQLRQERGLSQEEVAHAAGVATSTVSRIERASIEPRAAALEKIAKGLGVTLVELAEAIERTDRANQGSRAGRATNPKESGP